MNRQRADESAQTDDDQQIEQIGADNVAECNIVASIERRRDADGSLRQRCAECDNGQTDNQARNLE